MAWLTVTDAAPLLGLHPQTIYRWVREGYLQEPLIFHDGTHIYIDEDELKRVRCAKP